MRTISNNNFFDKSKQYQSSLSPNVCLPHNRSQPRLLNINNQKVQHCQYTVFALLADWVTLALLFFLAAFAVEEMAFSNSFCCLSVNSFPFCPTSFRRKSLRKASNWSFLTWSFSFFVEFINFIGNFISNISKCFCVPSKTLKKRKN